MSDDLKTKAEMALSVTRRADGSQVAGVVDLEALKLRFFQHAGTLSDFCALVDVQGLYPRASREGWVQQRQTYRAGMSKSARARMIAKGAEYEAELDWMTHRATKKVTKLISSILTATAEAARRAEEEGGKQGTLDDLPKLRSGIEALNMAYTLARKTAGLSAEPMPGRGELDLSKLAHEEREMLASLVKKASRTKH